MYYEDSHVFAFTWMFGWDFARLKNIYDEKPKEPVYICSIQTESYRVSLMWDKDKLVYIPYFKKECSWVRQHKHALRVKPFRQEVLESEKALRRDMEYQLMLQFRDAVDSYYKELPSIEDVVSALGFEATDDTLRKNHFSFYESSYLPPEDADGLLEVLCEKGKLIVPYDLVNGTCHLRMREACYEPDSCISVAEEKLAKLIDKLCNVREKLRWTNLRFTLDKPRR